MTPQYEILIGMKVAQKESGSIVPNTFYGREIQYIEENKERAREVYRDVFRRYLVTALSNNFFPPKEWAELEDLENA